MTLAKNLNILSLARHEQKIILGENGPPEMLVGAQDDFFADLMPRLCRQMVIKTINQFVTEVQL